MAARASTAAPGGGGGEMGGGDRTVDPQTPTLLEEVSAGILTSQRRAQRGDLSDQKLNEVNLFYGQ
jgi:hypothetical protein